MKAYFTKNCVTRLIKILQDKAYLDMHNETGAGNSGFSKKYEEKLESFDIKVWMKKNEKLI